MDQLGKVIIGAIVSLMGIWKFYRGFEVMHRFRMIKDVPRSTARALAMGLVEIHGKAKAESVLLAPLSRVPCVWYRWEIEVKRNSGKRSEWDAVNKGERYKPFLAVDNTGEVSVYPRGARFNVAMKKQYKIDTPLFAGTRDVEEALVACDNGAQFPLNSPSWSVEESRPDGISLDLSLSQSQRVNEYYISVNDSVYVLGTAVRNENAPDNVEIKMGDDGRPFIISDKSETELISSMTRSMWHDFGIGGIMIAVGLATLLYLANFI